MIDGSTSNDSRRWVYMALVLPNGAQYPVSTGSLRCDASLGASSKKAFSKIPESRRVRSAFTTRYLRYRYRVSRSTSHRLLILGLWPTLGGGVGLDLVTTGMTALAVAEILLSSRSDPCF